MFSVLSLFDLSLARTRCMDSQAKHEFAEGNYHAALEIYERLLLGSPEDGRLILGKARTLAMLDRPKESLEVYRQASTVTEVKEEEIGALVDGLVNRLRAVSCQEMALSHFACEICEGIPVDPTTLPCGHTSCENCLNKSSTKKCKNCGEEFRTYKVRTNVVLQEIVNKSFSREVESVRLRLVGNGLLNDGKQKEAYEKYLEADKQNSQDPLLQSNISHVLLLMGKYQDALERALKACALWPSWPKGYYRKGCALIGLQRNTEAALAFLNCLLRDQQNTAVQKSTVQIIHKLFREGTSKECQKVKASDEDIITSDPYDGTEGTTWVTAGTRKDDPLLDLIGQVGNSKDFMTVSLEVDESPCEKKTRQRLVNCGVDDFECTLCCRLLYEPVTTPCGHVFCRCCLDRSLDHRPGCPICRNSLTQVLASRKQNVTVAIQELMQSNFPEQYKQRKQHHEEELNRLASVASNTAVEIPVFVCTLAVPLMPCPLHIFEPRYRLMVRQCMESGSRQFGMCTYDDEKQFSDFGTMLEILEVRYLPDGRSFVDTVGGRRFKVVSRGMRDGYSVANVEWIRDDPVPEDELGELKELHKAVYDQAHNWFNSLPLLVQRRIVNNVSDMPRWEDNTEREPHGSAWLWWMTIICPLDPPTQVNILSMTSLRRRLQLMQRVIGRVVNIS